MCPISHRHLFLWVRACTLQEPAAHPGLSATSGAAAGWAGGVQREPSASEKKRDAAQQEPTMQSRTAALRRAGQRARLQSKPASATSATAATGDGQ